MKITLGEETVFETEDRVNILHIGTNEGEAAAIRLEANQDVTLTIESTGPGYPTLDEREEEALTDLRARLEKAAPKESKESKESVAVTASKK